VPLNLIGAGGAADYVGTGTWSSKAFKDARRVGDAVWAFDGKTVDFRRIPTDAELQVRTEATYLHYTTNTTTPSTARSSIARRAARCRWWSTCPATSAAAPSMSPPTT